MEDTTCNLVLVSRDQSLYELAPFDARLRAGRQTTHISLGERFIKLENKKINTENEKRKYEIVNN